MGSNGIWLDKLAVNCWYVYTQWGWETLTFLSPHCMICRFFPFTWSLCGSDMKAASPVPRFGSSPRGPPDVAFCWISPRAIPPIKIGKIPHPDVWPLAPPVSTQSLCFSGILQHKSWHSAVLQSRGLEDSGTEILGKDLLAASRCRGAWPGPIGMPVGRIGSTSQPLCKCQR